MNKPSNTLSVSRIQSKIRQEKMEGKLVNKEHRGCFDILATEQCKQIRGKG